MLKTFVMKEEDGLLLGGNEIDFFEVDERQVYYSQAVSWTNCAIDSCPPDRICKKFDPRSK
jgi:hypothetical protein